MLAVEKDSRALPALTEIACAYPGRLDVLEGDALKQDAFAKLTPPIKVVANLPYNISTELLVRWLTPQDWPPAWQSLTLMFQREVAERIVAGLEPRPTGGLQSSQNGGQMRQLLWICPQRHLRRPRRCTRLSFM